MRRLLVLATALLLSSCATVSKNTPVDRNEPRRVVGTDNDVRIDGEVLGDHLGAATTLPLKYDITNSRQAPIAIADLIPETTYDEETGTVTISIGSEVPGASLLPHLISINAGETKSFSSVARVNIMLPSGSAATRVPRQLRLKVNFLDDITQFEKLITMTDKGLYDPRLADDLFPKWVERNQTVYTNALPMRWTLPVQEESPTPGRRTRRRG